MAKIKIADLPKNMKITKAEMRRVRGGLFVAKPVPAEGGVYGLERWVTGQKWLLMPFLERMKAARIDMMPTVR